MSLLKFNSLLEAAGLDPADVILLRHQEQQVRGGLTAYQLWRDDKENFDLYQSQQSKTGRKIFGQPWWASFVATPTGETMFVGLYASRFKNEIAVDMLHPLGGKIIKAFTSDCYAQQHDQRLRDYEARLYIEWGLGYKKWTQYAANQNKTIVKLSQKFDEPEFPGLMNFIEPLSRISQLPATWIEVLKNSKGIYLLTCPRTAEQYVGSASGADGFYGRWMQYASNGHGGNVRLKSREPSDYQVCILEVAGSSLILDEILELESKWKIRLQTREMGLTAN